MPIFDPRGGEIVFSKSPHRAMDVPMAEAEEPLGIDAIFG
jgi:hypothetical protein